MSVGDSVYVAIFMMTVVFFVLLLIFLCIKFFSLILGKIEGVYENGKDLEEKKN